MNKLSKLIKCVSAAGLILLQISCGNNETAFKRELIEAAKDKTITLQEQQNLSASLSKVMRRSHSGVAYGTIRLKTDEDVLSYLQDQRKCVIEGKIAPVPAVRFDNFHLLLEASASMSGYLGKKGNPDFTETIIALTHCGDQETEYQTAYVTGDSYGNAVLRPAPLQKFLSDVTNGKFATGGSSPLDKIFEKALSLIVSSDGEIDGVSCILTDGLLSGTPSEIRHNPDFTIMNLPLLEDRIRNSVQGYCEKGLSCLVYRLETSFKGVYFDYRNGRHNFDGDRPYFVILFGAQQNLEKIEERLLKESNFSKKDRHRFASYDVNNIKTVAKASLLRLPGAFAIAKPNSVEYELEKSKTDPVEFGIRLQLADLPSYYWDDDLLEKELSLSYLDATTAVEIRVPNDEWLSDAAFDDNTKLLTLKVRLFPEYLKKMPREGELHLVLAGHQDNWYRDYSVDDDRTISLDEDNTFALDRFMGGIMKGFGYDDQESLPSAIDLSIEINKKS